MSSNSIDLINSQIDVATIVDNLMYLERAPVRRMQSQVSSLQSKVSAFQTLNTRISSLLDKVENVLYSSGSAPTLTPYTFTDRLENSVFSKGKVISSDESVITASAGNVDSAGAYSITVSSLAQAKSMVAAGFADTGTTNTGTGVLTITTGSNDPVTVTIGSSNNTLSGVCSAINAASAGVTATIINDGTTPSPYRLLITADESGTANAFTVTDNLSGGQALSLSQNQAATDAQFEINGVAITKSSNTVSDVISGVTFTLKDETASVVSLNVDHDTDAVVNSLNELVSAYNTVNSYINGQFTYNATTKTAGTLSGDSTLRSIQSNLQQKFIQGLTNRYTSYSVAGQIGMEFNRDGSLALDESQLREALADDFTGVAALLLGDGTPAGGVTASDSRVTYNSKTSATQAGAYEITVASLAEQASVVGNEAISNLLADEALTINYGSLSANANLSVGDNLTTVLSKINSALSANGIAATATNDGSNKIKISTNGYGSAESISVVSDLASASGNTGFGTTPVADTGVNVAGTINGNTAVGSGRTLTGATGEDEEGLSVIISQTVAGNYGTATVASESEGVEGGSILMNLYSLLDRVTDPLSGPIHYSTDSLNQSIKTINENISNFEDRLVIRQQMLEAQYNMADQALKLMQISQASIEGALAS